MYTFDLNTAHEAPYTKEARHRNIARTVNSRMEQRIAAGGQPTRDQIQALNDALRQSGTVD